MNIKFFEILIVLLMTFSAVAETWLPAVFSDHMIFQADQPIHIWGTASPNERIAVKFDEQHAETIADKDGAWSIYLDAQPASSIPSELEVRSLSNDWKKTFSDVLVGEVWMASGQSNMQFTFRMLDRLNEAVAQPENKMLRLFNTPRAVSAKVKDDTGGQWEISCPAALMDFSAVAYYFGSRLQQDLDVPVGIIVSAWGGTKVETWMPMEDLKQVPELHDGLVQYERLVSDPFAKAKLTAQQAAWQNLGYQDPGNHGYLYGYADPDADLSGWKPVSVPTSIESVLEESKDGAFWFRRTVRIPDEWIGQPLTLKLGVLDDMDQTYVNGIPVGSTGQETAGFWMTPRSYSVPEYVVAGNELTVAVRVFDMAGQGGFLSGPDLLKIALVGQEQNAVSLAGNWQFKAEYVFNDDDPLRRQFNQRWGVPNTPRGPANLYNAMIAPFLPFSLKGVIWYQGESNASEPELYSCLFPGMIESWRRKWNQPEMPFIYVELASFMAAQTQPSEEDGWAWQREAQQSALALSNTAVATALDVGDATNIHPEDKATVGDRLALAANGLVYGRSGLCQSPRYASSAVRKDRVYLSFKDVEGGFELRSGTEPQSFAICGKDRVWHWAEAKIDREQIVVWSPDVPEPVAVRYAWANNPNINVYSRAGLPLLPFRTDRFPRGR
ncbi:sialate O-acetylesterase [Tichowtungia aerotolerans]|uniref:Sialate O-acetylesterase domain-containing protein n=1 Tax=Tichowtungia aerotolerans TaxID=2697043 RepID=A0A6P1MFF5_9BACT|nr:sialate O-acetylesterase [Tichowtungia aerotolerans]QHI70346.1 hypothetical protein GT409_13155 [Tichowtungia aerotolerans]